MEGGAKACNAAAFAAVSFPPLQGITYVGWPHGRSREGEERDAIFTLVQNTRRPNIRVLRGLLHCAKRDRALRRKIGHGRETEEGRLALGSFSPQRMAIFTHNVANQRQAITRNYKPFSYQGYVTPTSNRTKTQEGKGVHNWTICPDSGLLRSSHPTKNVATQPFVIAADWLRIFSRPSFQVKHRLGVPPGSQQQLSPRGRMNDQVPNQTENSDIPAIYAVRLSDKVWEGDL